MARLERFTFVCDVNERRLIDAIASRLGRSRSNTIRFLIVKAARELAAESDCQAEQPAPVERIANDIH